MKVLWAVDALAEDKDLQKKTIAALKSINRHDSMDIEPIYIMGSDQARLTDSVFPVQLGPTRGEVEEKFRAWTRKTKVPGLKSSTILVASDLSLRTAVKSLLDYARSTKVDLIVASTLARKGATRFLLGSFAETLMLRSEIPVFLIQPKAVISSAKKRTILFPTDFSEKSKLALDSVVQLAKANNAGVTLFHQVEFITPYTIDPLNTAPLYRNYVARDIKEREKVAKEWGERLKFQGITAEVVVNTKASYPTDAILAYAKKTKPLFLAMASQSGPILSHFIGGVARQVVRQSPCPVWIVHPVTKSELEQSHEPMALSQGRVII